MSCKFVGFEDTLMTPAEIRDLFQYLPMKFQKTVDGVHHHPSKEFKKRFKFLNSPTGNEVGFLEGKAPKRVWHLSEIGSGDGAMVDAAARFVPFMVRQAAYVTANDAWDGMNHIELEKFVAHPHAKTKLAKQILAELLYMAMMVNISQAEHDQWKRNFRLNLLARGRDNKWVSWVLSGGLAQLDTRSEKEYAEAAYGLRNLQKSILRRVSAGGVKDLIKSKYDKPYQRSVVLSEVFSKHVKSEKDRMPHIPEELTSSLRDLVLEGDPTKTAVYNNFVSTLRVL